MSQKKSKFRGGKLKEGPPKLSNVEETFYQLAMADCEKKINSLKQHLQKIEIRNKEIGEQIRSLYEDKVDKAADLTRELQVADETIYKLNEQIYLLNQEYTDKKCQGDANISDLEDKYKAMHDQLTAEIKLLKAQVTMLEDYSKLQGQMSLQNENEEERLREKQAKYKESIENMERKIKAEHEAIRKELEMSLLEVSTDFTRSSAMRNAAYAQRLIRENIAIDKEVNILVLSLQSMEQQQQSQTARLKDIKATFPALKENKRELIVIAQQKTFLIEKLTSTYERLKASYTDNLLYKNQYQCLLEYRLCEHYGKHRVLEEAKRLGTRIHALKTEYVKMKNKHLHHDEEIRRIYNIIALVRSTIHDFLKVDQQNPEVATQTNHDMGNLKKERTGITTFDKFYKLNSAAEVEQTMGEPYNAQENNIEAESTIDIVENLLSLLKTYVYKNDLSVSMETISPYSTLFRCSVFAQQSSDSLREHFKNAASDETESSIPTDIQAAVQQETKLIPNERTERNVLFDVEKGSTLYVSSSESNPEIIPQEEVERDDMDASSSYESISQKADEAQEKKLSKTDVLINKLPPGSIVDVKMQEEIEGEPDVEEIYSLEHNNVETLEDEEEMSILFF